MNGLVGVDGRAGGPRRHLASGSSGLSQGRGRLGSKVISMRLNGMRWVCDGGTSPPPCSRPGAPRSCPRSAPRSLASAARLRSRGACPVSRVPRSAPRASRQSGRPRSAASRRAATGSARTPSATRQPVRAHEHANEGPTHARDGVTLPPCHRRLQVTNTTETTRTSGRRCSPATGESTHTHTHTHRHPHLTTKTRLATCWNRVHGGADART